MHVGPRLLTDENKSVSDGFFLYGGDKVSMKGREIVRDGWNTVLKFNVVTTKGRNATLRPPTVIVGHAS